MALAGSLSEPKPVELVLEDLLLLQQEQTSNTIEILSATVDINFLIDLINRKFYVSNRAQSKSQ